MHIVVIGAGGVGGYFGGRIAQAGYDVTFVARGKTFEVLRNKGLHVKSIKGDFVVKPKIVAHISDIKDPDLILLGIKSWQVTKVAEQLKDVMIERTMVLPLQNGVDNADKLRAVLDHKNVLAGFCKIVSKIEAPGVIDHFGFEPEVVFGEYDNSKTDRIRTIKSIFDASGFTNTNPEDIHLEIWKKFLFIATISGIGALTRSVFGVMREDDDIRQIIYQTANEIVNIANAKGIGLSNAHVELVMKVIDNLDYNTTASMQRDIMEGRPSELETFNGYIVKAGKELHIITPANSFIYHCLLPMERKASEV
jgi:2-dehydropantoate 2-reductase